MSLTGAITGLVGRTASGNSNILDAVSQGIESLAKAGQTALGSVTRLTEALTDLCLAPLANAKALAGVIGPLVAAFNPGVWAQFSLAIHDTHAVLGAALMPIMRALTVYVRQFGDVLAGMLPILSPLTTQLAQFVIDFGTGFTSMLRAAAPLIQVVTDALSWLIKQLSYGIGLLAGAVTELLNVITSMFGLTSRFDPEAKSAGFGTRQVRTGTVDQFAQDVFASNARNAYNRDVGAKSPQQASEELRKAMDTGREAIVKLTTAIDSAYKWLKDRFGEGKREVDNAVNWATAIEQAIRNALLGR